MMFFMILADYYSKGSLMLHYAKGLAFLLTFVAFAGGAEKAQAQVPNNTELQITIINNSSVSRDLVAFTPGNPTTQILFGPTATTIPPGGADIIFTTSLNNASGILEYGSCTFFYVFDRFSPIFGSANPKCKFTSFPAVPTVTAFITLELTD